MNVLMIVRLALVCALFCLLFAESSSGQNRSFRDCDACPEMVPIPPGTFTMGVSDAEEEKYQVDPANRRRSAPQRQITLSRPFAVGKFELKRSEFAQYVREINPPPSTDGCWNEYGFPAVKTDNERRNSGRNDLMPNGSWDNPGYEQDGDHPVVCINWSDILSYLDWLSRKTGKRYRLLSEAEWEYTARAGSDTPWPWGEDYSKACEFGNVSDRSRKDFDTSPGSMFACEDGYPHTAPGGRFPPNAFGVHDMVGNIWEVTADCFSPSLEQTPLDGSPAFFSNCIQKTSRGGAFDIFPWATRSGYRSRFDLFGPARYNYEGFRVARDLD